MSETAEFGRIVLIASVGFAAAIVSSRLSTRLRLPSPALFLIVAAVASDLAPRGPYRRGLHGCRQDPCFAAVLGRPLTRASPEGTVARRR